MHTTPTFFHELQIKPITCTPEEWQTLLETVQEMGYGERADLIRACLATYCRRIAERQERALAIHAAKGINDMLDAIDFLHDPRPVTNFLREFQPDAYTIAGGKGVPNAG